MALRTSDLKVGGSNPSGRATLPYLDRAKRHRAEPSLGGAERREDLVSDLGRSAARIGERVVKLPEGPSVLTIEWLDPVWIGGMWTPELVTLADGTPLVTER